MDESTVVVFRADSMSGVPKVEVSNYLTRFHEKRSFLEYIRMDLIDRATIQDLLLRWQRGELTEREVHERAEVIYEPAEWPELPHSDPQSIAIDVLSELSVLNAQLITVDDIPAMLRFLHTAGGQEEEAWKEWRRYWDTIDYVQRKQQLRHIPYYLT